jgi:hypothetical protein
MGKMIVDMKYKLQSNDLIGINNTADDLLMIAARLGTEEI